MAYNRDVLITIHDGTTNHKLSDHNRSELKIDLERIGTDGRTASGTRKRYHVADKRKFSCDWKELPGLDANTVDAGIGFNNLRALFLNNTGSVTLKLTEEDDSVTSYTVHITGFDFSIKYRWQQDYYYNCGIEFEEV